MGKSITPATRASAKDIVERWLPKAQFEEMKTGESGHAPFKVTFDGDTYCLKIPIVPEKETGDDTHMKNLTDSLRREAKLTQWAGASTQVAPPVCYLDAKTGSYATRFISGRSPTVEEMGTLRRPIFSALRGLHAAPTHDFPATDPRDENWLLNRNLLEDLTTRKYPCSDAVCKDTLQLLTFVEDYAQRRDVPKVAVHSDLYNDNIIINGSEICFIDMANLRLADPMLDVAHYCHETYAYDLKARPSIATLASDYTLAAPKPGMPEASTTGIALQLARFDIRRQAFSREWSGGTELQDIVRSNCLDLGDVFRERGFVTPSSFA